MQRELTDFELPPLGLNWGLVQMGVDPWTFPTDDHPFFLPPVSGNQSGTLSIHHSVGRAEWKWVGWVNSDLIDEQWRRKTNSVKCGYHLSENEDDWTWEIQKLFCEKSNAAPKEALKSVVCKCRQLGLTNAKRANQQIQTSAVRKYICMILTNPWGPAILMANAYMLERSFIQIITHIAKMIRWCIGSAIPINDFIGHQYQKYDTG